MKANVYDYGIGPELVVDPLTHRLCRYCNRRLPASRYFRHEACARRQGLQDVYGPYEYGGVRGGILRPSRSKDYL